MEYEVLGPVRLRHGAEPARLGRMQRTLLAVLLVHADRPVPADVLTDALWPDAPDRRAEQNLRLHVHRMRRSLGDPGRLVFESGGYRLRVFPGELDAERFEVLADEAAQVAGQEPERGVELARKALNLWRGRAYDGLDMTAVVDEAQRLEDQRLTATETLHEAELACGRGTAIVAELSDLVRRHPLRERLAALLMTALYRSGRQADALQVYQDTRRVLVDELGLEPGPELRAVEQQVLAGEPVTLGSDVEPARVVPAQLPVNVHGFVGRDGELAELDELLSGADDSVRIATLAGSAGVGKTSLAVRWAHRVRDQFPDGQLYVDLRGFGPDEPLPPGDALAGFLRALGVDGTAIPPDLDERAADYRSRLDGRRVLVVLDNVRTVDQVRRLLPGAATCFVLLTSREALTGLGAREGARRIDLNRLTIDESRRLLEGLLGERVAAEPEASDRLVERCARLPLALRIAADLVLSRPARGVAGLVEELADERDRLDLLDADDSHSAVRAVFSWSYQQLSAPTARVFRMCGLHPGRDVDAYALAALADLEVRAVRRCLDALVRAHLVDELPGGRFWQHDLLRAYSKELAGQVDTEDQSQDAIGRLSAYYLYTSSLAMDALVPQESQRRPCVQPVAAETPPIGGYADARRWLERERSNLLALVREDDSGEYLSGLSGQLAQYLVVNTHMDDALDLHGRALALARRRGDVVSEANTLRRLGAVYYYLDQHDESVRHQERALALHRESGDRVGEAAVLNNLGTVHRRCGRYREALGHFRQAMPLYRDVREQGLSEILANLGAVYWQLGRYDEARAHLEEALEVAGSVGNRAGLGTILSSLAEVAVRTGRLDDACDLAGKALDAARGAGVRYAEAQALTELGQVSLRLGDPGKASTFYQEALDVARAALDNVTVGLALVGLARTDIATGVAERAVPRCREAVEIARARRLRPVEAEALLGCGDAYAGLGDADRARERWRQALEIYHEMGVPEADAIASRLREAAAP